MDANWDRAGETSIRLDLFGEVVAVDPEGWVTAVYAPYVQFRFPAAKLYRALPGQYLWETTTDVVQTDYLGIVKTINDIHGGRTLTEWFSRAQVLASFKRVAKALARRSHG